MSKSRTKTITEDMKQTLISKLTEAQESCIQELTAEGIKCSENDLTSAELSLKEVAALLLILEAQ